MARLKELVRVHYTYEHKKELSSLAQELVGVSRTDASPEMQKKFDRFDHLQIKRVQYNAYCAESEKRQKSERMKRRKLLRDKAKFRDNAPKKLIINIKWMVKNKEKYPEASILEFKTQLLELIASL